MAAQHYWFKARGKQRVGWVPSSWQGWIILLLYVGFLIHSFLQINAEARSINETLVSFFPRFLLFTSLLTIITYLTGETITWHHEQSKSAEDEKKEAAS